MDKLVIQIIWTTAWLIIFLGELLYLLINEIYDTGTFVIMILFLICIVGEFLLFRKYGQNNVEEETLLIDRGMEKK